MILYPAIDLKDGQAVRLYKGEMDQATVFNDSPADKLWPSSRPVVAGFIWWISMVPLPAHL